MYVVLHVELVLHIVAVRIDGLMGIARQLGVVLVHHHLRQPVVVVAGLPLRTVAAGAAHLVEQLLTALYGGIVQVACAGNGQTAMPHHEGVELLVAHPRAIPRNRCAVGIMLDKFELLTGLWPLPLWINGVSLQHGKD